MGNGFFNNHPLLGSMFDLDRDGSLNLGEAGMMGGLGMMFADTLTRSSRDAELENDAWENENDSSYDDYPWESEDRGIRDGYSWEDDDTGDYADDDSHSWDDDNHYGARDEDFEFDEDW